MVLAPLRAKVPPLNTTPLVMLAAPFKFTVPPLTAKLFAAVVELLAKVPAELVRAPAIVNALLIVTVPAPLLVREEAPIAPPLRVTVPLELVSAMVPAVTPPASTAMVAALPKVTLSPVKKKVDWLSALLIQGVFAVLVFQAPELVAGFQVRL